MAGRRAVPVVLAIVVMAGGCGPGELADIAKAGRLVLDDNGTEVVIPLERFDLFLADEDFGRPDDFVLLGEGVALPGQMPRDVRVGYDERWEAALHQWLEIRREYEPGGEGPFQAHVTLPGRGRVIVLGGDLRIVEILGRNPEGAGSVVRLEVDLLLVGEQRVEGTAEVVAVTWG